MLLCSLMAATVQAQQYKTHTLAKGETLSMLAQKYNTTVGDIMRLNDMNAGSQLSIGQKIKIPPAGTTVDRGTGTTSEAAPVVQPAPASTVSKKDVHVVQKGETLYGLSKKYGVTMDQVRQWNNLSTDQLEIGLPLAVSAKGISQAAVDREAFLQAQANVAPVVQVEKTVAPPVQAVPVVSKQAAPETRVIPGVKADGSDCYFAKLYQDSIPLVALKTMAGPAMTFKTASGWSDKKYYILMNEAASGSIVKVKAPNGNIIYAKVLWPIDDINMNEGLSFRISEAGAAALGIQDNTFGLVVQYHN